MDEWCVIGRSQTVSATVVTELLAYARTAWDRTETVSPALSLRFRLAIGIVCAFVGPTVHPCTTSVMCWLWRAASQQIV